MSLRNYIKKLGRRKAGVWGRINHKRDMRAASKAIRKELMTLAVETIESECEEHTSLKSGDLVFYDEPITYADFDLITDEEPH